MAIGCGHGWLHDRKAARTLLLLVAVGSLTGCAPFGDNSTKVRFHNSLEVPVDVYESDGTQKGPSHQVEGGQTFENRWIIPPERCGKIEGLPRQVEAAITSGQVVFCHRFTYEELQRIGWLIEIERRNDCQ